MAAKASALIFDRMGSAEQRRFLFLLAVSFVVLAAGFGLRGPWPPDEPRFALIAREMAEHGQWLFPHVGGVLYPDKPPLFFWIVAGCYSLTGSIDIAFLLPGLVSGLAVVLLVADLGRRIWGANTGLWAAATLLVMVQFPWQMRGGQIDALLCLWTTLGLYGFLRHLLAGPDWRWYGFGGAAAGLGIMTKGVGFLPYLVFVPMIIAARSGYSYQGPGWRDARWLLAPLVSLAVIAMWLVPMLFVSGTAGDPALVDYRDNILFHQTVTRYADAWGHIKPPWYLLTNAALPLWMPVPLGLPWLIPAWRRDLANRHLPTLMLLGWVFLVLLFFSLSDGKRGVYIFPAAPAVALLVGRHAPELLKNRIARRLLVAWPAAIAAVLLIFAVLVIQDPGRVARQLHGSATAFNASLVVLSTGAAMLAALVSLGRGSAIRGVAASLALFWVAIGCFIAPVIDGDRSGRTVMRLAEQQVPVSTMLGLVGWPEQFLLQATQPVYHFGYRRPIENELEDGVAWLQQEPGRVLLLPAALAKPCFDLDRVNWIGRGHRRNWVLADGGALLHRCESVPGDGPGVEFYYRPPLPANDLDRPVL